jgi:hypothetical protein
MGIVGMFLIFFPLNDVTLFYWWGFMAMGTASFAAGWLIALYVAGDLAGCLIGGGGPVAYVCHLAGAACGVAGAVGLLKGRVVRSTSYEKNLLQVMGIAPPSRRKRRRKRVASAPSAADGNDRV